SSSKSCFSGKDVINLKNNSLKDIPSGCKEYAPNNSWLENKQIQVTLETYHDLVGSERIEKKTSLLSAIWLSDVGKAKVTKRAGKFWEVFGHTVDSEDWLLPEEALFLLETNALELFRDDVPLSLEETYSLVIGDHCSLEEYRVYSHLSRKGYRVLRHDKEITLTAYEKDIHLNQVNIAEKRSVPSTTVASRVNDAVGEKVDGQSGAKVASKDAPDVNRADKEKESQIPAGDVAKCKESSGESEANNEECVASSAVEGKENGEETVGNTDSGAPPSLVVDVSSVGTDKEASSDVEIHDESDASTTDKLSASGLDPLKKRGSSLDLYIVEDEQDDVIEIDDEDEDETPEVVITEVKMASQVDTVDLMDSEEEDDDIVFICQKSANKDPSKWRKWFLTIPVFVNTEFSEENDQKPTKLKLIDMFDLGNKTIDTIMKAIPRHDGSACFINAPDLRFIPQNIVPKFAHYRINVQTYDSVLDRDDASSVQSSSATPVGNVDTSQSLSQVVQYGREPANFSRNPYGYSFHRMRNNYRRNPWYQRNANRFSQQPSRPYRFNTSEHGQDDNPVTPSHEGTNQNNFNSNGDYDNHGGGYSDGFTNRNNSFTNCNDGSTNRNDGFTNPTSNTYQYNNRQNNFRGPWNGNQNNTLNNFVNNQNPGQLTEFRQNNIGMQGQLKFALQQACQMQMLAMSLMQNSQALIQNFSGGPNMFPSPPMNFGGLNRFSSMNNFNVSNSFNSMNSANSFTNNFNRDFRGRRPFRRPYVRRANGGRRWNFNYDRSSPKATVTEVVCIDSDEEDCKVKQKPGFKRMKALGAIAGLNSPKRTRVIEISEIVEDVKPGIPVKTESRLSTKQPNTEAASLSTKSEVVSSRNVSALDANSSSSNVAAESSVDIASESSQDISEVPEDISEVPEDISEVPEDISEVPNRSTQSPVSICDENTNSPTIELIDESTSGSNVVESTTEDVSIPESSRVPEEVDAEVDKDGGQHEANSEPKVDEAATTSHVTADKEVSVSWKSYKEGLMEPTIRSKSFSSLLSYEDQRAGVHDVLKSLQIFGPIEESTKELIKVSFDVYLPNQPFKKSVRLLPNYRVIVTESSSFPSVYDLNYLKETYRDDVPFLYAVVYEDSIGLYNLHSVSLPTLVENV
ncbi:hypothetical protein GE061_006086, partial [Apolygus lucorum]